MKSEIKNKKPLTLRTVKNTIKIYTTLSDILKQAGIKESKPKCEGKATKNKNNKTKKNNSKKVYSEDTNKQNPTGRIKKLRKPLKNYVVPYVKESSLNEVSIKENVSRDPKGFSEDLPESVQDKATIFVSLDFIEDCQKYKRKIRKGNWRLKNQTKGVKKLKNQGKIADIKGGHQKFLKSKSLINTPLPYYENVDINLCEEKTWEDKNIDSITENPDINGSIKSEGGKELVDDSPRLQFFLKKTSSDDLAKIDKTYLQSLLSCIKGKDENAPEYGIDETLTQSQPDKKTKITGKNFFERKAKTKEFQNENFSNIDDKEYKPRETQNECKIIVESLHSNIVSTRVVRDLTKSEEQIILKKAKNFCNSNNSNGKSKNVTYSKLDINDNRKKRKPRNKLMKNNVKEFIETSFPSEVSKVADVKELWRRETQKKSDNSLSSHSSCTVPESDEFPGSKNLGPYKILKKLVGEEINNIANKSENKDKTRDIKSKKNPNLVNLKNSEQARNICKTSPPSDNSNDLSLNEKHIPPKGLMTAKCEESNIAYDDKMKKSQTLNFHVQDLPQEVNPKIKQLEEKPKQTGKPRGQTIENWAILNRLEQAFLGLGTLNFQKNTKDTSALKGEHCVTKETSKDTSQILNLDRLKQSKIIQKIKVTANPVPMNTKKEKETSIKITKPNETANDVGIPKDKHQTNKAKKDSQQETLQTNVRKSPKDDNVAVQMKKKRLIRPETLLPEKKSFKIEPPNSKREQNEELMLQKPAIQKLSEVAETNLLNLNQIKISEQNLVRKKTFNIISVMDPSINQPQGQKCCGINNENNKHSKTDYVFLENLKNESKLKTFGNDAGTKTPKRLIKNQEKDKLPCQSTKDIGERKRLKSSKLPINRIYQGRKNEKSVLLEQAPQHALRKLESNKNITKNNENNIIGNNKISIGDSNKTKSNNGNYNKQIIKNDNDNNNTMKKPPLVIKNDSTIEKPPLAIKNDSTIEKPPLAIKNDSNNTLRERAVKKRSILSVHLNQTPRKLVKIKEKDNSDCTLENTQSYLNSACNQFKTSYSNVSIKSLDAYGKNLGNHVANNDSELKVTKTRERLEILPRLTSSSVNSTLYYADQDQDTELGRGESNSSKSSKPHSLWEQDISHYHTIVREIMSQYKRIDGFLKQTEHFTNFSNDSVSFATLNEFDDRSYNSLNNSHTNIDEYRKKIILEYQERPIFEYKSKIQEYKNGGLFLEGARKNLSVVKVSNTDTDLDVKDYQPNIQKVLDSQLYVDIESLAKRNEPKVKFKDKKASLQQILTRRNGKTTFSEDWKRSCSAPKTALSQNTPITLYSARTFSSVDKSVGSLTSESKTGYSQETESERFREIIGN